MVLMLALTACGSDTASADEEPSGSGEQVSLDFTAQTVAGDDFEGSSLAGEPVVLWYWAPWCSTCRAQISVVSELAEEHGDDVSFVGVGSLDESAEIAAFAGEVSGEVTQLADPEGAVWRHFEVTAQSTYLVLDADGSELAKGYVSDDELSEMVEELAG